MSQPPILLYTSTTPNGYPISMHLDELKAVYSTFGGYEYEIQICGQGLRHLDERSKEDWFIKLNPNGRIPTIVDRSRNNFSVFETSAILLYLSQHYDPDFKFWFDPIKDADNYSEMLQWIFFAHGGIGPMQGQAHHFAMRAPEDIPYAKNRYIDETKRLYNVLEIRLKERDYLAGSGRGKYSLADLKTFPWVRIHAKAITPTLDEFPNVKAWVQRIEERPATVTGVKVG
ncbi:hypothetical protein AGABI2DRAFT_117003 [Agaricus bisporus var. bisporus H97]|uniref:hypothetical protein n=1 Tax=Agaricus bisporus var. bisporus (strain H97 / ATCC MYA-4626 / FGSC 10389) TaxID=936046 RepID=UPI00029F5390|nr:hypothetical protein AGABI2DRAFT_117003 [Agaricus bisporus var. bisporus H97]EKV48179.1 hypothetical protein AGABI2DRAFT_117003 [Agaricus bisporus var. bisporus H97]